MKQVLLFLLTMVLAGSFAHAQDTLKIKYQTKEVIINDKKLRFEPIKLDVSEYGVLIKEQGKESRVRLKTNIGDSLMPISDFEVLNHRVPITMLDSNYFQLKSNGNLVNLADNLMLKVLRNSVAFSDSASVMCGKNTPYEIEFVLYNYSSDSIIRFRINDFKQIERAARRHEMVLRQAAEMARELKPDPFVSNAVKIEIFIKSQTYFTQKFVIRPDKFIVFNVNGGFTFISTNLGVIFTIDNQGKIKSQTKVEWPFSFGYSNRFLLDPATNEVYVITSKSLKSDLYSVKLNGLVTKLKEAIPNIDFTNCGVFNGTFYYLKHEMPYGKSVQSVRLK